MQYLHSQLIFCSTFLHFFVTTQATEPLHFFVCIATNLCHIALLLWGGGIFYCIKIFSSALNIYYFYIMIAFDGLCFNDVYTNVLFNQKQSYYLTLHMALWNIPSVAAIFDGYFLFSQNRYHDYCLFYFWLTIHCDIFSLSDLLVCMIFVLYDLVYSN